MTCTTVLMRGWSICSPEESPGLQLGEGAFAWSSQSGVVAVELLVMPGLFAVGGRGCGRWRRHPGGPGRRGRGSDG
jgi:hypothetical protein